MPDPTKAPARRSRIRAKSSRAARPPAALMVIDHDRLQGAAWAEFHTARKRLDKTSRDLHRHEETDVPAYESWLHRTFPVLVTTLRELHEEVTAKAQKVHLVQVTAAYSGGSLKRLWREQKKRDAAPAADSDEPSQDDFDAHTRHGGSREHERAVDVERPPAPRPTQIAREIYRRLVQHLHPDRGGEWTAKRKQLWHEVQQAWNAADADWLSRLEIEWESANEVLGPTSPLSRLRRAIDELNAARRDIERKLRSYRDSPAWRFTQTEKKRAVLHRRTEQAFAHDIGFLQSQLDHLNRTIAAWEEDWTRNPRPRRRHT